MRGRYAVTGGGMRCREGVCGDRGGLRLREGPLW